VSNYTGQQRFLIRDAQKYSDLGYKVGLAKGKVLLREYQPDTPTGWFGGMIPADNGDDFDGISIIPDGIVCVDIDIPDFGVVYEELPVTFKERTPRGWHLWYNLPNDIDTIDNGIDKIATITIRSWKSKIAWRKHVDLLTKNPPGNLKSRYRNTTGNGPDVWGGHILCSGTTGYKLMWPEQVPARKDLVMAPQWLQDALEKP
jgi:hypothetical protein